LGFDFLPRYTTSNPNAIEVLIMKINNELPHRPDSTHVSSLT
jgi:hypothetical protein